MRKKIPFILALMALISIQSFSQVEQKDSSKLVIGGYGEIIYQNFDYSDDFNRYSYPENFTEKVNRGQVDIPHLVLSFEYKFKKGWKVGSEIEFEHGGTGAEVEIEAEEFGEYENETEKGGEITLEQFWIEKSFSSRFNLRIGHLIVPVGGTNNRHLPTEYFTVKRPEGESTIIPQTWHETGISLYGRLGMWNYNVLVINGLDVDAFGSANWVNGSSVSPYEYKLATSVAAAVRIENYSINGLRWALSGYAGNSAGNSLKADRYDGLSGTVLIGSFDAELTLPNLIVRTNLIYGNLSESAEISRINKNLPAGAPSPHSDVAKNAASYSIEAGYNLFSFFPARTDKLYLFSHYNYYNSMENTVADMLADKRYKRNLYTVGLNYYPISEVCIKTEYAMRVFDKPFNQENTFSLGIVFAGMFTK